MWHCTSKQMLYYAREGVIGVLMGGEESMKEQVAAVLKANNAQMIHYWGRLTTERLGEAPPYGGRRWCRSFREFLCSAHPRST